MSPLPQPDKRKPLTKWQFATLFLEQMGKCAVCECRLEKGKTIDEHIQPLDALGSNDLSNRALYCKPCAQRKTDTEDKPRAAKGRRIRGETGNGPKRQIPSRGFTNWKPKGAVSKLSKEYRDQVKERMEKVRF